MSRADILIKRVKIVNPNTAEIPTADIAITNGKIEQIGEITDCEAKRVIDCDGRLYVMPGLIDMHVHLRDPGLTYKEDIESGCMAAKAGGFTAVACMPNTKPVIDNPEIVEYIQQRAKKTGIDVYPIACITNGMSGESLADYESLIKVGIKAISDDGRPVENAELMRRALELSNENNLTVISHCEDLNIINGGIINKGVVSKALGVKGMDRASEDYITAREISLAMSCNAHIHIAHVSTKGSVNIIRAAKKDGVSVSCETCPHYFMFTEEKLFARDADYRMSPPLRTEEDRKAVFDAVMDGTIDCIVTDHAPHSAEEKLDFLKAPNGVVGLETSLAASLTQLYHRSGISLNRLCELMSANPRKLMKVEKCEIKVGNTADLCIFDTDLEWVVDTSKLNSKSKNSVFKNEELKGKNLYTISKGKVVYE